MEISRMSQFLCSICWPNARDRFPKKKSNKGQKKFLVLQHHDLSGDEESISALSAVRRDADWFVG